MEMDLTRRTFLKGLAAASAVAAVGGSAVAKLLTSSPVVDFTQEVQIPAGRYTASVYVKAISSARSWVQFGHHNALDGGMEHLGAGWVRVVETFDHPGGLFTFSVNRMRALAKLHHQSCGDPQSSGDLSHFMWAQLERNPFPTSYIPTDDHKAVRLADEIDFTLPKTDGVYQDGMLDFTKGLPVGILKSNNPLKWDPGKGLLVEPAACNHLLWSQDFGAEPWRKVKHMGRLAA